MLRWHSDLKIFTRINHLHQGYFRGFNYSGLTILGEREISKNINKEG